MRHANTEKPNNKSDFDRLLTEKGKLEATGAAAFLGDHQIDKIIISYAKRTMQTAKIIQEQVEIAEVEIATELYQSDQDSAMELLSAQEDRNKHILVVGHNPLIYNLALDLSNSQSKEYEILIDSSMPTARVVIVDFPTIHSWEALNTIKGDIIEIFTP